jgi:hypothetical protein
MGRKFRPEMGRPEHVTFDALADLTARAEPGIQHYSGTATYRKQFDLPQVAASAAGTRSMPTALELDLGTVKNLARVRLNGHDLGIVWCAPWRVPITAAVKSSGNQLEVTVVNLWVNRLIGDEQEPEDCELVLFDPPERKGGYRIDVPGRGLKDLPDWLITGTQRPSVKRFTFTSWRFYPQDAPLLPSGLLGPVRVLETPNRGK